MPKGVWIRTAEHNRKNSEGHIGLRRSLESRQKQSVARKGKKRPPFSDEWRKALR